MMRVDLYGTVHKGLAAELFETTAMVARTDFGQSEGIAPSVARVRRILDLLGEHAETQRRFVLTELERFSPVLASEFQGHRTRLRGLEGTISDLLDRITTAPERELRSLGYRLHAQLRRLVAEHLLQMERAETTANRALWAYLTDDELRAIRMQIVDSLSTARLAEWVDLVMGSVSGPERAEIEQELDLPPGASVRAHGHGHGHHGSHRTASRPGSDEPEGDNAEEIVP